MRAIKFNFVYGIGGETDTYFTKTFDFGEIENGCHWDEIADSPLLREYAIVGKRQFTGLKDKNGNCLYDQDIFEVTGGVIYRIEWNQEYLQYCIFTQQHWLWFQEGSNHFKYCHQHDSNGTIYFLHQLESYEIEVIGNIHQNPELLEGNT